MKTLKYAIRFLMRAKSYTLINLLGLAFSLACSIILLRYIHRELTVDTHCVDRERVVVPLRTLNKNVNIATTAYCDSMFIPESQIIRRSILGFSMDEPVQYEEQKFRTNIVFTDSVFLQMFDYPLREGSAELSAPDHAVITEEYARRLFGQDNPIGKVLNYEKRNVTVRGVIGKPSCKVTLNFDILLSRAFKERNDMEVMEVLPGVDLEEVNKVSNVLRRFKLHNENFSPLQHKYEFMTLKDFYFNRPNNIRVYEEFFTFGSSDYLGILSIVAVLLLFVGVLNFINLYMVYMMKRQKEYGIKKVYGLQKFPLFLQIWSENVVLAFSALMVAWLIIEITQVPVARLMGTEMNYTIFDLQLSLGFLLGLPLLTSVYPYIRYQYMSPITSMRTIATNRQSVVARMLLLSVQYVVTFVLVVFSLYLNKHFLFMINTPKGFNSERVLEATITDTYVNINDFDASIKRMEAVVRRINACPDIEEWIQGGNILKDRYFLETYFNDKDEPFELNKLISLGPDYMKLYGLKVVEGELPDSTASEDIKYVVNRAAMKLMGFKNIEEAFIRSEKPEQVQYFTDERTVIIGQTLLPVVAVIDDFYSGHITEGVKPMVAIYRAGSKGGSTGRYYLQVRKGKEQAVIDFLREVSLEVCGTKDFEYKWMDDYVNEIYDEDRQVATIYTVFALIAIAVSCLGLFGISLFDIRQRYREIGIRKVNGASMKDLYKLLFRKYVTILGIAFVIATPLAYYAIHVYTADFVVKASLGIDVFVVALLIVALISLGTLFWQVRKAASINPSEVMKSE